MPDLVLHGLGSNTIFGPFLTELLGFKPSKRGKDWVIPEQGLRSVAKRAQIVNVLPRISLKEHSVSQAAQILAAHASNTFDPYLPKKGTIKISSSDPSSLTNEIYALQVEFLATPINGLKNLFEKKIIPLMLDKFNATHVTPITTDAITQQAFISLTKIALLLRKSTDIEKIGNQVFKDKVLGGILPPQTNALSYINCLSRLIPSALSLPFFPDGLRMELPNQWRL